jgi:hypothetical protein
VSYADIAHSLTAGTSPALLSGRNAAHREEGDMTIRIVPNEKGIPQSKLAEAEIVFEDGVLNGLKLVGFTIWEGREGRHVTFPARPFAVNGERRSYALLRPVSEPAAQDPLRQLILQAFVDFERQAAALIAAPLIASAPNP